MFDFLMFNPFYNIPNLDLEKPPTIYEILNSIVNGDKKVEDYTKIKDLPLNARQTIFNFDYPLSNKIDKTKFETNILKHYLMRRIGFETVTAFQINLDAKLNEIMPIYNKMFDAFVDWSIFEDGEKNTRNTTSNTTNSNNSTSTSTMNSSSTTSNSNIAELKYSDTPQNSIQDIKDGNYMSSYNYNTNTSDATDTSINTGNNTNTANGTDNNIQNETINRSPADKITILAEMQEKIKSIYTMIYKDLDNLFYQLV